MSKVTLTDLTNLQNDNTATAAINANNAVIETAFDNTLSRDGSQPNAMNSTLDMNTHPIINLPTPTTLYEPLRVIDRTTLNGGGTIPVSPLPLGGTPGQVLTKASSTSGDVFWKTISSSSTGNSPFLNILDYGGDPTDTNYNDTALSLALGQVDSRGCGCIYFPPGVYKFNNNFVYTLTGTNSSLMIMGAGVRTTQLHWPNANGGLRINQGNFRNNINIRDFSITTGQVGTGGVGLDLYSAFPAIGTSSFSYIENIMVHGDDYSSAGFAKYWSVAIRIHLWSLFNLVNVNTYGKQNVLFEGAGTGLLIEGDVGLGQYGIIYNMSQCSFNYHDSCVIYGDFVQGMTLDQCNFNGANPGVGILSGGGYTGLLSQLAVSNCQFGLKGSCISLSTGVYDLQCVNNIFSHFGTNVIGVFLPQAVHFNITGNKFFNYDKASYANCYGLVVGGGGTCGTVVGNSFVGLAVGYNFQVGTSNISAIGNAFLNTDTKYVNSGTSQTPGIAQTANPMP